MEKADAALSKSRIRFLIHPDGMYYFLLSRYIFSARAQSV